MLVLLKVLLLMIIVPVIFIHINCFACFQGTDIISPVTDPGNTRLIVNTMMCGKNMCLFVVVVVIILQTNSHMREHFNIYNNIFLDIKPSYIPDLADPFPSK